jgi:uncharacterized protein with HEPN domain
MRLETRVCLEDLMRACELIRSAVSDLTLEQFLEQWEKQSAVERQFIIVGETLIRIQRFEPNIFDSIPDARGIVGFRNVLVHGYDVADPEAVYDLAGQSVQELVSVVGRLLNQWSLRLKRR